MEYGMKKYVTSLMLTLLVFSGCDALGIKQTDNSSSDNVSQNADTASSVSLDNQISASNGQQAASEEILNLQKEIDELVSTVNAKDVALTELENKLKLLEDEKQQTANSIVSALRQIEKCRTSIVSCKANVALAEKSYELALDAYNRGARDFLSLQDASDTLFEAQVALLSEAYQLGVEILSLEDITGVPFGTFTVQ